MPYFDLPINKIENYLLDRFEPINFGSFWKETLCEANQSKNAAKFEPYELGLKTIDCYDVTFSAYNHYAGTKQN